MAENIKTVVQNKKARHEYFVEETIEAGLELFGTEVKSLRQSRANLRDSYVVIRSGEAFANGFHISPYEQGNIFNKDPLRPKKLLLHKSEIHKLEAAVMRDGYTLIPLSVYFKGNRAKMQVGVCKGKKLYDRRESIKQRDDNRQMQRALRDKQRD
ncbi:SsrA-binding protein SmpB [Eubacteriales bacterium OttesenSCG-928-N14]|nr:SsrA-binding protein SmpB [Eubacteriales bacterium OttesenSCG-928-N14]